MSEATQAQAGAPVLETTHGGIAVLIMNRPDRLNALNDDLAVALNQALDRMAANNAVRVVVLTGAGRAFCAGGDLAQIGQGRRTGNVAGLEPVLRAGMQIALKMRTLPQPVIAAVNGPAAGAGMNIALAANIRIAAEEAMFGQNFAKVGLYPDYGRTFFLPELVGPAKAAELIYTGDMINAREAERLGVVNKVVPLAQLETEIKMLAQKLADGPQLAIRAAKKELFARKRAELERALEEEVRNQLICFHSEDCAEGITAFFEKRAPKFQGK